ncbi:hypothetical protein LJC34_02255 [Oscillospiraceae bacterium OttesenSCG-928-G22]|nr:hypothetical protein [Oscillospiraceae bacterium OttesenSCG-928-G22]
MADKQLARLAEEKHYTYDKARNVAYGQMSGFQFTIAPHNKTEYLITFSAMNDDAQAEAALSEYLATFANERPHIILARYQARIISIGMKTQRAGTPEALSGILSDITAYLNANYFKNACKSCGEARPLHLYSIHGKVEYMCDHCFTEAQERPENKKRRGNVFTGILGGLIFSLAGVALWVIIYQLGFIAGIAGVAMMGLVVKGYELFGGNMSRGAAFLCFLLSLVMILVAHNVAILTGFYIEVVMPEGLTLMDMDPFYVLEVLWTEGTFVNYPYINTSGFAASSLIDLIAGLVLYLIAGIAYIAQVFRGAGNKNEMVQIA